MKMTLQNPNEIKIFILFLLDKVGYPLSYSKLGTIVIRDEIIDYFAYFEYFCELVEAGHIGRVDTYDPETDNISSDELRTESEKFLYTVPDTSEDTDTDEESDEDKEPVRTGKYPRPTSEELSDPNVKYIVTKTGRLIARSLSGNILMAAVREKSIESAMRHLSLEEKGADCSQTFDMDSDGYVFNCSINDAQGTAMKLSVRADTIYQLNRMRLNFDERPDVILRGVIALLTGNVNYLFED